MACPGLPVRPLPQDFAALKELGLVELDVRTCDCEQEDGFPGALFETIPTLHVRPRWTGRARVSM